MTATDQRKLYGLVLLATLIGIGSFSFHTRPTRLAEVADVVPIGMFMLAAFACVLRWGLDWSIRRTLVATGAFASLSGVIAGIVHATGCGLPAATLAGLLAMPRLCLNGSWTYVPAFIALMTLAGVLSPRHPVASRWLAIAAALFATGLIARTLDLAVCPAPLIGSSHALWHLCSAISVYAILRALIALAYRRAGP